MVYLFFIYDLDYNQFIAPFSAFNRVFISAEQNRGFHCYKNCGKLSGSDAFGHSTGSLCALIRYRGIEIEPACAHCQLNWLELIWWTDYHLIYK